ncbi:MAG: DUF177 domain-containing protein [Sphingomonadales bacterium]|nr:DUF177 domain-containing protein [Sphingomonadales bacterium]
MSTPEFSRVIDLRSITDKPVALAATAPECAALARRFDLVAVHRLEATVTLVRDKDTVRADGRIHAEIVQACAISAEDLAVAIDEPLSLRFVPPVTGYKPDEEIEIDERMCDEIEFTGGRFDLGEAVAQSLALAIDPFLTGPQADAARAAAGLADPAATGPFAALAALKPKK